ncbi:MAG: hypothetical protein ACH37Z_12345 [Anaerolineae bacterium]
MRFELLAQSEVSSLATVDGFDYPRGHHQQTFPTARAALRNLVAQPGAATLEHSQGRLRLLEQKAVLEQVQPELSTTAGAVNPWDPITTLR